MYPCHPKGQLYGDNPYVCPTWGTLEKDMYHKYYESYAFFLAQEMIFVYFSLFWLKKVHFEAEFNIFSLEF